ncbi:type I polyketide synthase [Streptomyces sp. NBC_01538]|uniref:type I polyketide synthase n=1 Tax=Streptomyces sp. NBC_01538 TaxID=2903897 RepID=UPI003868627D
MSQHLSDTRAASDSVAPIAVVGLSCRLPGAPEPAAFWAMLREGEEAIRETPPDRWNADAFYDPERNAAGKMNTRRGGFVDGIDKFDASFFEVSPREAAAMDPQQRLALELSWEALEDARIVPDRLHGTRTGVFIGAVSDDYALLTHGRGVETIDRHTFTGLHRSIIANRVSYFLGLTGPSIAVDSAQSSSLVSVHLACESLRNGESQLAIAGGVHLNIVPESTVTLTKFGALSPDGRCYTFDARANGFVRGEGGGLIVLKPLDRALADGDRVHCVIRGSAVNSDGRTRGLAVPSRKAHEELLGLALRRAGLSAEDIQYVELHGPGTPTGDPIEAAALGAALGQHRPAGAPLLVGSVKTNVGHLEGAAGIIGLLKTALSIKHRLLPPSLHYETPNPRIPLEKLNLRVQTGLTCWPDEQRPLIAGVSSLGVGGTNAHVILEEAPAAKTTGSADAQGTGCVPWVLSARSPDALRDQAARLRERVADDPALDAARVARALVADRALFEHRAVVVGEDRDALIEGLTSLAADGSSGRVVRGRVQRSGGTVFVFPGEGSLWEGMARELLETAPVFAESIEACERALSAYVGWSLNDVLRGRDDAPSLARVDVAQPVLFSVMVSLAALWRHQGVEPDAVVGHAHGEIAAAYVAGALSLEDAAKVVALRSRAIGVLAGRGGMAWVPLAVRDLRPCLDRWEGRVSVAAVDGPTTTVVSGDLQALNELVESCQTKGIDARMTTVDHAAHSAQVDGIREDVVAPLRGLSPRSSQVAYYSTLEAGRIDTVCMDAEYWYRNLRDTVRLSETVQALAADGYSTFVESSPHPVLTMTVQETIKAIDGDGGGRQPAVVVGSIRRDEGTWARFLLSLGTVFTEGVHVDWTTVLGTDRSAHDIDLPTYPFQRRRHWLEPTAGTGNGSTTHAPTS